MNRSSKDNGVSRLASSHYLGGAGLSKMFTGPFETNCGVTWGTIFQEGKALSYRRLFMLSKNNHSRVLFYPETGRKLDLGTKW